MLFHLGTVEARTDKFYHGHLRRLIRNLKKRGYGLGWLSAKKLSPDIALHIIIL